MRLPSEHRYKKSDFYKKHLQTGCEVVYNSLRQRRQKKAYGLCHTLRYFLYAFFCICERDRTRRKNMSYVDEIIEAVVAKNPSEPEFHQAVK